MIQPLPTYHLCGQPFQVSFELNPSVVACNSLDVSGSAQPQREPEVHTCLRKNWDNLEPECRAQQITQKGIEDQDVELNPLMKPCMLEIDKHCTGAEGPATPLQPARQKCNCH